MAKPQRIRLSRQRGFRLQDVSRALNGLPARAVTRPGIYGNPFTIPDCREAGFRGTDEQIAERVVEAFRAWIDTPYWRENWLGGESERTRARLLKALPALRGHNLACHCPLDAPCHADVLLEMANREPEW